MLFSNIYYYAMFLPLAAISFWVLSRYSNILAYWHLIVVSFFFYGIWDYTAIPILLCSVIFNYFLCQSLCIFSTRKKIILAFGVMVNIFYLVYFKYTKFIISSVLGLEIIPTNDFDIVLPLGISFFTFTQIALLVDTYRESHRAVSFSEHLLFVVFFPHLIAGPIYHHKHMMPQFRSMQDGFENYQNIFFGIIIFLIGLCKKVLFADNFAVDVDDGFSKIAEFNYAAFELALFAVFAFVLQIYFDFSGYTDMAIGSALFFNVKMPVNFLSPLKACSISDFWKRWHITLSEFLTSYVFRPLTIFMAKRLGKDYVERQYVWFGVALASPVLITFLISGIWHGAGWTFMMFGLVHGIALVVEYSWKEFVGMRIHRFLGWVLTMTVWTASLVFFRSPDLATSFLLLGSLAEVVSDFRSSMTSFLALVSTAEHLHLYLIAVLLCFFAPNTSQLVTKMEGWLLDLSAETNWIQRCLEGWGIAIGFGVMIGIIFVILSVDQVNSVEAAKQFIYFEF